MRLPWDKHEVASGQSRGDPVTVERKRKEAPINKPRLTFDVNLAGMKTQCCE